MTKGKFWIKAALCVVLFAAPAVAGAQAAPDNDDIFAKTMDGGSPFNYVSLMMRYRAGDMTLTAEDYRYLYYGFAFRDEYEPLQPIPAEDKLLSLFGTGEEPGREGMLKIIEYAGEVMKHDPFSPRNLNYLTYAHGAIGDTLNERINSDRFDKVVAAIESSGSGMREDSPWHVLRFDHATDVVNARGASIDKQTILTRTVARIDLQENDSNTRGYYFDFSRVYWKRPEQAPQRTQRLKPYTPPVTAPPSQNRNY